MKFRPFIPIACVLTILCVLAAIVTIASRGQQADEMSDSSPAKNRLKWHADKAKARGQKEVVVSGLIVDYDGSNSNMTTDQMLSYYEVVKAEPVDARSYEVDSNVIATWYKFKIKETLSQPTQLACPNCVDSNLPAELLPVQPDEFLLWKSGGSLVIDGVKVTMLESGFPPFKLNQEYLLLIAKRPSGVAEIGGGPIGAFVVNGNGKLTPVSAARHPVKERLIKDFGDSVDGVRQKLKGRSRQ